MVSITEWKKMDGYVLICKKKLVFPSFSISKQTSGTVTVSSAAYVIIVKSMQSLYWCCFTNIMHLCCLVCTNWRMTIMITQCLVSHSFWSFSDASAKTSGNGTVARSASRRKRTSFSKEHVELLRATFETDPYPGISLRESLSQTTGLPESRIQVYIKK